MNSCLLPIFNHLKKQYQVFITPCSYVDCEAKYNILRHLLTRQTLTQTIAHMTIAHKTIAHR